MSEVSYSQFAEKASDARRDQATAEAYREVRRTRERREQWFDKLTILSEVEGRRR